MIFFITGASSFIGVELCRYLIDNGHQVIAMSRKENEHLNDIANNGRLLVLYADMQNLTEKAKDVKADIFIHLAWIGALLGQRDNQELQEGNIRFSLNCVELSKRMGCQLYVDAGSQAEYGVCKEVIDENEAYKKKLSYKFAKWWVDKRYEREEEHHGSMHEIKVQKRLDYEKAQEEKVQEQQK